jgi:Protein of unknown function (DUF4239)
MALGSASRHTEATLEDLWAAVQRLEPRSAVETSWHERTLGSLESLSLLRRQRLLAMRSEVPGIMWSVLLIGGLLTVGYTNMYGVRRLAAQAVMTGVLAACIALVLAVSVALDHPFAGPTSVNMESFDDVLQQMEALQAAP